MVSRWPSRSLHLLLAASFLVAMLPTAAGADVHEQQLVSNTFVNISNQGLANQVSYGQQLRTNDYVIESTFNQAVITKVSVFLQKSTTSVAGNVCMRLREPGWANYLERNCVAASSLSTTAGWVDFTFGSTAIYSGQAHREFWVDYDGTCTSCVRLYYQTTDVYRPGDRQMVRQNGPDATGSFTLLGGDLAFKLTVDHSPIIRAARAENLGLIAAEGGYRYRMVIGISDNSQMPVDTSFRWGTDLNFENEEWFTCLVTYVECWWEQPGLRQHQSYTFYACGYNYAGGQCTRQITFNTPNVAPSAVTGFDGPAYGTLGYSWFYGSATDIADTLLYEVDINQDNVRDCWTGYDYESDWQGAVGCNFQSGGTYNVRMRARDNSPNGGVAGPWTTARQIIIDPTAPGPLNVRSPTHSDSVWSTLNDATVVWDEADTGGSAILGSSHRLDGASFPGYTKHTSASYVDLADGPHVVDVRVRDNAGNVGSGSFRVNVDTLPPSKAMPKVKNGVLPAPSGWYTTAVPMEIDSADAGSGIKCERYRDGPTSPWLPLDDADLDTCSGIADWTVPADGVHTYQGFAKDVTDQSRAAVDTLEVKMDRAPPTGVGASKPAADGLNGWHKTDVSVTVGSSDATSQVACEQHRASGTAAWLPVVCAGEDAFVHAAEGTTTYDARATDNAGLVTEALSAVTVKLDKTPPTLARPSTTALPAANGWHTADLPFTIESSDATSQVACEQHSLSATGPWTPLDASCTAADSWTHGTEGSFTYYGRAVDNAGWSRQGSDSFSFKLDKTPPTVQDNQADRVWTNANPVLDVNFGDARSGIWRIEYTVNTAAAQAGTVLLPYTSIFSTTTDGTGSYVQDWQVSSAGLRQGDNYVSVRVTDRAGLATTVNDVVKIQWDTVPPTKATPTVVSGTLGENSWYTTDVGLAVDSADATSQVATEWHGQVLGQWFGGAADDTWTDSSEGTDGWYGRAVDKASNEFTSGLTPVKVDKTNPVGSVAVVGTQGTNGWFVSNVDATVSMLDTVSGSALIGAQLDGGAWSTVAAASRTLQVAGDGIHTLAYYGKDFAGRTSGTQAAPHLASIKIDRAGPVSTHSLAGTAGSNGWHTSAVTVTLAASDATSGHGQLWSSVDGGSWQSTTASSLAIPLATAGTHSVSYYAVDLAGNADGSQASPRTVAVKIDLANPSSSRGLQGTTGTNGWYTTPVTVTLAGSDSTSGVAQLQYGLDPATAGTTPSVYSGPFTIGNEGVHALNHRTADASGRLEAVQSTQVKVDVAAPGLSGWVQTPADIDGSTTGAVTVKTTVAAGPSGVATVRFRYSYDNGALWSAWASATASGSEHTLSIPAPGAGWWAAKDKTLRYEVNAVDGAGNQVTVAQTDFVQRLAPVLGLVSPSTGGILGNGLRTIQWNGQDLDRDTVTYTVRLSSDGGATFPTTIFTLPVNEDGAVHTHSYTWDTRSVADGANYAIRVDANDGQQTVTVQAGSLTVDNTAPTVTLVSPEQGMAHLAGGTKVADPLGETRILDTTMAMEALAEDSGSWVGSVQFRIDGGHVGTDSSPDASGLYAVSTASPAVGKHYVSAQAFDAAGNMSPRFYRDIAVVESQAKPPAVPSATQVTQTVLGLVN